MKRVIQGNNFCSFQDLCAWGKHPYIKSVLITVFKMNYLTSDMNT